MAVMQGSASHAPHTPNIFQRIGEYLQTLASSIEYAKAMQSLCSLSDAELKQLGITRSDIPTYAEKIVDERH